MLSAVALDDGRDGAGGASGSIPTSTPDRTPRSRPARPTTSSGFRSATRPPPARAVRTLPGLRAQGARGPHRQPAHQPRAARGGVREARRDDRASCGPQGMRSGPRISAAGWARTTIPALPPPPTIADYGAMVERVTRGWDVRLIFEPGRLIVGDAGVLLTEVIRVKPGPAQPFVVVDAAMNDLMRPSLYDAWHAIDAVDRRTAKRWSPTSSGRCARPATRSLGRATMERVGGGRADDHPHRRRLCRDDGKHLQFAAAGAGGAGQRRPLGRGPQEAGAGRSASWLRGAALALRTRPIRDQAGT